MGFGSMSPGSLLLIIIIILLIFGTSRLKNIGKDLAEAIKNFRQGMSEKKIKDEKTKNKIKEIEEDKKKDKKENKEGNKSGD